MTNECPKCQTGNPEDSKFCKECATPLPGIRDAKHTKTLETQTEELTRGSVFAGRYEIIEELGKGGMGKVFRVEDRKIKQEIALKLIKPDIASDKKTIERFKNELTSARDIRHKNVCGMFDLGEEKGQHYITMEYVSGGDLKRFIRRVGQLPSGKAISIAKQICAGLGEAHSLGVVHRDLKPSNIMIDDNGNARIMDFGIARAVKSKGITGSGIMIGTPEYMSPEQAEAKEVDRRSDIYSLGVILYEMVTGRLPFEGESSLAVAMKHKGEIPKSPKDINPQIPDDLSRVILNCLEKEKTNRFQSAGDVQSELEKVEKGFPTTDRIIPPKKTLTSQEITVNFSLNKIFIPVFVAITLAVILLILWSPWSKKKAILLPSDKPSLAIMYLENNTGDDSLDHLRKGLARLLISDISQSRHLRILSADMLFDLLKNQGIEDSKSFAAEDIKRVAGQGGYQNILVGSFHRAGDIFRINVELRDSGSWELLGTETEEFQGENEQFAAVDRLTKKIKARLKLSSREMAEDIDRNVGDIITSSPEALKLYLEGARHHSNMDYALAAGFLEKAVKADPDFASAYRKLAMAYGNQGRKFYPDRDKYMQKAFDLKEHASELEKYLIIGSYYHHSVETYTKSVEAYKKALEIDPDHSTVNHNLAIKYEQVGDWEKAIFHFEVARRTGFKDLLSYNALAQTYQAVGDYDKAREVYEEYLELTGDSARVYRSLANNYVYQGDFEKAEQMAEKANELEPGSISMGWPHYLMGEFELAEKEMTDYFSRQERPYGYYDWMENLYRAQGQFKRAAGWMLEGLKFAEETGSDTWKRNYSGDLCLDYLLLGKLTEAMKLADKLIEDAVKNQSSEISGRFMKMLVLVEKNDLTAAEENAERLRIHLENPLFPKRMRYHFTQLGIIALKRGDLDQAVENLEKAYAMWPEQQDWVEPHAFYAYYIGEAYYKQGNLEKARESYEEILGMTTGRAWWGHLFPLSFYKLGIIEEESGNSAKAKEFYEKFLSLWKDADPGIAEVEDAKKKLTGLK